MKRLLVAALAVALVTGLVATTGCRRVRLADEPGSTTEAKAVPRGDVTRLDATIRMGAGEMTVSSDASSPAAMNATFTFAPTGWRPDVSYTTTAGVGTLRVEQPDSPGRPIAPDRYVNVWNVTLGGGVPTDLDLTLGVGKSDIDLRGLDLTALKVLCGVGNATIDLTGPRTTDLKARIETGVGNTVVRLPRAVGVKVNGRSEGIGHLNANGFTIQDDSWVNDAWSADGPKLEIDLVRSVGNLTLELVD